MADWVAYCGGCGERVTLDRGDFTAGDALTPDQERKRRDPPPCPSCGTSLAGIAPRVEQPRWNGEPCEARRVYVIVADAPHHPLYWARGEVGKVRAAVEVTYGGEVFLLDDEDGSATDKVYRRGGGPEHPHRSLYGSVVKER